MTTLSKLRLKDSLTARNALQSLEDSLREKGILPSLTDAAPKAVAGPKHYDNTAHNRALESKRLCRLEAENIELKAKVKELENKLTRFGELSETLSEMGFMPR